MDGTDFPATVVGWRRFRGSCLTSRHGPQSSTRVEVGAILDGVKEIASDPKRAPDRPGIIGNIRVE
jgi:hypothetical protein